MAAAADGMDRAATPEMLAPPQPPTFLEEIQALETRHDNPLSVSTVRLSSPPVRQPVVGPSPHCLPYTLLSA
jgi:hypothetical protein